MDEQRRKCAAEKAAFVYLICYVTTDEQQMGGVRQSWSDLFGKS